MTNKPTDKPLTIDLQPRGVFLITLSDNGEKKYVKGRFSMMALDRFCEQQGINNFLELISKITLGMSIKDYARLVVCAIQDYYREDFNQCPWNESRVMDEIFDVYGFGSDDMLGLFRHAIGRVTSLMETEPEAQKKSPAKKK